MTRNAILLFALLSSTTNGFGAESPVVTGLGGAERAGVPQEGLYANPASLALLDSSFGYSDFVKPKIPEMNAGGREYSGGVYDAAGDPNWKGAAGYDRVARAVLNPDGTQGYEDDKTYRFAISHPLFESVAIGAAGRYMAESSAGGVTTTKHVDGDVGAIFPILGGLRGGATLENLADYQDNLPLTVGGGLNYNFGYRIQAMGDAYRILKGSQTKKNGFALAADIGIAGDFSVRAGRFEEAYRRLRGWSAGASWGGPRMSLNYAFHIAGTNPHEQDHVMGLTLAF